MNRIQIVSAWLLAVPLVGSAVNHALRLVPPPLDDGSAGAQMWEIIRDSGLMNWLAAGHLTLGILLLWPRTRFAAALLQLPITLGIVAFNVTMFQRGVPLALAMFALNAGALLDRAAARGLLGVAQREHG